MKQNIKMNKVKKSGLINGKECLELKKIYDKCIICNILTEYKKTDSVYVRNNYVEGCGQICNYCFLKLGY